MNKNVFKLVALIFLLQAFAGTVNAQDPQKAKMAPYGRGYLEYLPEGYETSTTKYPAIIFLHGSGERGTGTPTDLAKLAANGPPMHIKNGHKMGFTVNGKTEYFIVLSPQTNDWSWEGDVIPFVKYALQTYRIDPDRVYLTGLSMGGEGAWFGVSQADNEPNYFAAAGVMCGRAAVSDGSVVAGKHIAIWAFHGDADTAIPIAAGQRPISGMTTSKASPAPIWTVYPGGGHSTAWTNGYKTDHSYHNPNLYEWFLAQKRQPYTPNIAPTVNAGVDKTVALPTSTTTVTATSGDTDGTVSSYYWTKVSGPTATLTNASSSTATLAGLTAGTYVMSVTVTDNYGAKATDQLNVVVSTSTNTAPVVNAGSDKTVVLPTSSTTIAATATDTDGSIAAYKWIEVSGPAATMSGTTSSTLAVSSLTTGTYTFSVTATDNLGATATDQVSVVVKPNVAPTVNAGADKTITLPTSTTSLTATATDSDGTIATYAWTKVSGPAATLGATNASTLSISGLVAGTYTFSVTVTDNSSATASDQIVVYVNAAAANILPVVEAGTKNYITLPVNYSSFTAVASDADGTIVSYTWKKIGGGNTIVMTGLTSPTLNVSGVVEGTYVFRIEVADNSGGTAVDTVRLKVYAAVAVASARTATLSESSSDQEDAAITLGQNYPNPFSTQTTIPFSIDESQHVMIKLYSTNGTEVATLVNENFTAGSHTVELDSSVLNGNATKANAIYYYKMFTRSKVTAKQLVIRQ